jgi:hypothetical protein
MEKCLRASQHKTYHNCSNYIFNLPAKCTGAIEYLYSLLNICYVFRHLLCHPLITYQNHLFILRLIILVNLQSMKYIYFGLFTKCLCLLNETYSYPYIIGNTVLPFKSRTEQNDKQWKLASSEPKCEQRVSQHKVANCPTNSLIKFHIL